MSRHERPTSAMARVRNDDTDSEVRGEAPVEWSPDSFRAERDLRRCSERKRACAMTRAVVSAILMLAITAPALAEKNPYLDKAIKLIGDLEDEKALQELSAAALADTNTASQKAQIWLWTGVAHYDLGRPAAAEASFKKALHDDPNVKLPDGTSPKILDTLERLRRAMKPAKKVETIKAEPVEPKVVTHTEEPKKPEPRKIAKVEHRRTNTIEANEPMPSKGGGVSTGGLVLGGVALVALGVGGFMGYTAMTNGAVARDPGQTQFGSDAQAKYQSAQSSALLANILYTVAGVTAIGSIIMFATNKPAATAGELTISPTLNGFSASMIW